MKWTAILANQPSRALCDLRRHIQIQDPLLPVELLDHLDGRAMFAAS